MKRIISGIVIFIIYIVLGLCFINLWMSDGKLLSNSITVDEKGHAFFMEQGLADLWIKEIDQQGQVVDVSLCAKVAREVQGRCCYSDGKIYILQIWYEEGKQHFAVCKSDNQYSHYQKIWEQEIQEDLNITDFFVEENAIRISGIEQKTEEIVCYSVVDMVGSKNVYQTTSLPVAAYWGDNGLYVATNDNRAIYFSISNLDEQEVIDNVIYFRPSATGFIYQKENEDTLTYQQFDGLVTYTYQDITNLVNIDYNSKASTLVTLSSQDNGLCFTFFTSETDRYDVRWMPIAMTLLLKRLAPAILLFTLIFVSILIIASIFYHWIMVKKRLLLQTFGILTLISVVWISMMCIYMYKINQKQILDDRAFYAETCVKIQKENLMSQLSTTQLTYNYFNEKETRKITENILSDNTMKDTWKNLFARTEMLYGTNDIKIAFSEENAYGTKASSIYANEIIQYIKNCNETSTEQSFTTKYKGIRYVFHIVPLGSAKDQLCLMIRIPVNGVTTQNTFTYFPLMIAMIGAWILIMVVLLIFLQTRWQTITLLISQMDKVSKGDYKIETKKIAENEIGDIWTSMERMCKNLQMQNYKNNGVLDHIFQFAPRNFERLFGKENLQDIEIGETMHLPATIGMISIIDKDTLLKGKVQKQYLQYVNQLMEILFKQDGAENAVFLQSGSNLENVKAIFTGDTESVDHGLQYGISCMESLLEQPEKRYESNPFMLFHTSDYLCGLAGGSKQAYPFIISMELDILNSHIRDFRRNGVRMVVTEQTRKWINHTKVNLRYIGYIASDDEQYKFDLYEVLDCYSLGVKAVKMNNLEKFQKALNLFYDCNYYLARSTFSEIIKDCPEDGITRWYIFACEALFNREDISNSRHDLFFRYDK